MTNNRTSGKHRVDRLRRSLALTSFLTAMIASPIPASADGAHLMSTKVTENLYMLTGDGGNIGVMIGNDGTFLIDDQMAPASPELLAVMNQLGGEPPRLLINTHFQFDHTGGNELLGATGTTIFSHEMARTRLADGSDIPLFDLSFPPIASDGLPVVTFKDSMSFRLNDDIMRAVHTPQHIRTET